MCKRSVMFLPSLLVVLLLPCVGHAQGGGFMRAGRGNTQVAQLVEEVMLLQQLATLALTDEQLSAALALYKQYPPEVPADQKPLVDKLSDARQRLLKGTPLSATELQALFELYRGSLQRRGQGPGQGQNQPPRDSQPEPLGPLGEALWAILTQTQKAIVLGDVRQAAANNQKFDQLAADRALKTIGRLKESDEATWTAARNRLAESLSSAAGATGTPARDNSRSMFTDFLDRIRKMPDADFAAKQGELSAGLAALMPPGSSLTVAMAEANPGQIQGALAGVLLHPRAPQLLQELQAARVKAP